MTNEYWPVAWNWFSEQDSNITSAIDRPAFLSWWDYGFEAIEEGAHPSVADNFQNGYTFAGSFLMCQTEDGAIALFIVRCIENEVSNDRVISALQSYGVDTERFIDIMNNPSNYIDEVLANPDVYGEYDSELSASNAKYAAARVELNNLDHDTLVELYNDVREITGNDIGYVSVDSRLFPFTATSSNIFYAPAKLSDQRLDASEYPYDYYTIYAVDYYGNQIPLDEVTSSDYIAGYEIVYTEAFYDTMLYRAFMGYGPSDVGRDRAGPTGHIRQPAGLPVHAGLEHEQLPSGVPYRLLQPLLQRGRGQPHRCLARGVLRRSDQNCTTRYTPVRADRYRRPVVLQPVLRSGVPAILRRRYRRRHGRLRDREAHGRPVGHRVRRVRHTPSGGQDR